MNRWWVNNFEVQFWKQLVQKAHSRTASGVDWLADKHKSVRKGKPSRHNDTMCCVCCVPFTDDVTPFQLYTCYSLVGMFFHWILFGFYIYNLGFVTKLNKPTNWRRYSKTLKMFVYIGKQSSIDKRPWYLVDGGQPPRKYGYEHISLASKLIIVFVINVI